MSGAILFHVLPPLCRHRTSTPALIYTVPTPVVCFLNKIISMSMGLKLTNSNCSEDGGIARTPTADSQVGIWHDRAASEVTYNCRRCFRVLPRLLPLLKSAPHDPSYIPCRSSFPLKPHGLQVNDPTSHFSGDTTDAPSDEEMVSIEDYGTNNGAYGFYGQVSDMTQGSDCGERECHYRCPIHGLSSDS